MPDPTAVGPAPMATLNGTIQPPPPNWDPYATPPAGSSAVFPQGPYMDWGHPAATVAQMQRFIQDVRADYYYYAPIGSKPLGLSDIELSTTLAIPFLRNAQTPLLITPGFAAYFWQGPDSPPPLPPPADMPAETFDAYLDLAWNPQLNDRFGGELSIRTGIYSDFRAFDEDSIRLTGRALAVMTFSPATKIKFGIWYLNLVHNKLLPVGGVVWSPNPDVRFDILFPNPKFTERLPTVGATEWWWYFSGNYGGDAWTIKRGTEPGGLAGALDQADYEDIRIALGLDFKRLAGAGLSGLIEFGGSFDRHLDYATGSPSSYSPSSTIFLRGSLAY